MLLFISPISAIGQNEIKAQTDFEEWVSGIKPNESGIVWISDGKCGDCLLVFDQAYHNLADSLLNKPFGTIHIDTSFGRMVLIKYRINRLPAGLEFNNSGQLLRRIYTIPKTYDAFKSLNLPFDTLPRVRNTLQFDTDYPEFFLRSFEKSHSTLSESETADLYFNVHSNFYDEKVWAVVMRFNLSENLINRIITEKDSLIKCFGKNEVYEKLDDHFFYQIKKAARERNEKSFAEILTKAEIAFEDAHFRYTDKYKTYYFQLTENWQALVESGYQLRGSLQEKTEIRYQIALVILKNSESKDLIAKTAAWFKSDLSEENQIRADLKAYLLYKSGDTAEAIEIARQLKLLPNYSKTAFPYTSIILQE
jgi:hypothetical protein